MGAFPVVRAECVGSLLQPEALLEARAAAQRGELGADALTALEDEAVRHVVALQQDAGLQVVTDGEMRRSAWADTARHLSGIELRPGGRSYPSTVRQIAGAGTGTTLAGAGVSGLPTVVDRVRPIGETPLGAEFGFLKATAQRRAKFTMAAPSYHRRYWSDELSRVAYPDCESYLVDVRDWLHDVARVLVASGCDYLQLDAPNYGSLCDPDTREFHRRAGHDLDAEIAFDAALDSSVFEGLDCTRALHVCRGNMPGGEWHSAGGYGAIAPVLFPNLAVDVLLLEYDSDRAGDFAPIAEVPAETVVALGLLTTKDGRLEDRDELVRRVEEAAGRRPLDSLALCTQCGFASAANAPMSETEERAKLGLVGSLAGELWR